MKLVRKSKCKFPAATTPTEVAREEARELLSQAEDRAVSRARGHRRASLIALHALSS